MPKIVLGWQLKRPVDDAEVQRLITRVKNRYQELFEDPIEHRGLWQDNQGLLSFDIQAAADPGVNVTTDLHLTEDRIICVTGKPSVTDPAPNSGPANLDALSLYQQVGGDRSIRRVNPPFTLCSFDKGQKSLRLVHDGLGMDSFFIAETAGGVAFSNKCWCILDVLGETPRIDYAAWRYWFCVGSFPENSTPFQNIRYLDRGEDVTGDSRSVVVRKDDAMAGWVVHGSQTRPELMDRAEDSLRKLIVESRSASGRYQADLTGGVDSRAMCSVLLKEQAPCTFSTEGERFSRDVVIAGQLAKQFHLKWEHRQMPKGPDSGHILDAQFRKLALWGEGLVDPNRFASYTADPAPRQVDPRLSGGSAEISSGTFYAKALLRNSACSYGEWEGRFLDHLGWIAGSILTREDAAALRGTVSDQISSARAYGLEHFHLLDCFYIGHRIRRWQSAHLAANLFNTAILPFVNIEHIKLGFAMDPVEKAKGSFQKSVIKRNAERLLTVPFNKQPRGLSTVVRSFAAKASVLLGRPKEIGSAAYFQSRGSDYIRRVTALDAPLEKILDFGKREKEQGWLRLGDRDWYLYLRLISFCYWHDQYIAKGAESGTAIWR